MHFQSWFIYLLQHHCNVKQMNKEDKEVQHVNDRAAQYGCGVT